MPRRRRNFIDRSRAKTFQLVHGVNSGPSEQVFVPQSQVDVNLAGSDAPNVSSQEGAISASDFQENYNKKSYELGEYGLDEDYDYSKHFRTIGGGGGVYMDAVSGMPKPEAVASSSANRNNRDSRHPKEQVVLRDSFAAGENERVTPLGSFRTPDDVQQSQKAVEDIRRDRKYNKDLDEVIAALDSDGELDLTASEIEDNSTADALDDIIRETVADDSDLLEDDFVAVANGNSEKADAGVDLFDGVKEEYREPRLLDAQFERFMQGFEVDDADDADDEEEEELRAELLEHVERVEDFSQHLAGGEFQDLWQDEELLQDLSNLQIEVTEEDDGEDSGPTWGSGGGAKDVVEPTRSRDFNEFRAAEFERGMTGLLDSYKRVSANEAFAAVDGLEGARDAIARAMEEEKARIDFQGEAGLYESDGHDSELDSHFDEAFKDKGEQWDCETIVSTYSNLENHPSVIDAPASVKRRSVNTQPIIRLDPKTQAPAEFMPAGSSAHPSNQASASQAVDYGSMRDREVNNVRAKGETREEKKARKVAVKEAARERRALKSEMRKVFGAENVKQGKHAAALGASKVTLKF